jgi:hypothetical protein
MIYSFIATGKANDIEPREWFEDVIRLTPEYENDKSNVTHLLPKNGKPMSKTPINVKQLNTLCKIHFTGGLLRYSCLCKKRPTKLPTSK